MLGVGAAGAVRRLWAADMGVDPSAFAVPGVTVVAPEDPTEVVVVALAGAVVVGSAVPLLDDSADGLVTLDGLVAAVGDRLDRPLGANLLLYADTDELRRPDHPADRPEPVPGDDPRIEALEAALGADEWDASNLGEPLDARWAMVREGAIVALVGLEDWDGLTGQIAVAVHPEHRGLGLAGLLGGQAAQAALDRGLVPQWRVRPTNPASLAVALRLGFEVVGHHLAVAIHPPTDPSGGVG